jgi:hypothetical protein
MQRIILTDSNCDVAIRIRCLDGLQERLSKKEMTEVAIQEFVRILSHSSIQKTSNNGDIHCMRWRSIAEAVYLGEQSDNLLHFAPRQIPQ